MEHSTLVGHSILEFEGDPRLASYLRDTLEGAGARVALASSTAEALEVIEAVELYAPVIIKPGNRRESVETLRRLLRSELVANAVAVAPSSPAAAGCMSTRAGPRAFEKPTDDVAGL